MNVNEKKDLAEKAVEEERVLIEVDNGRMKKIGFLFLFFNSFSPLTLQ